MLTKQKKILIFFAVAVVFFVLANLFFFGALKNTFYFISSPIQKPLWSLGRGVGGFFDGFFNSRAIKTENEELLLENFNLKSQLAEAVFLKQENEEMRKALGVGLEKEFTLLLSKVIAKEFNKDVVLINRGEKDGVKQGMPVITNNKVLVGVVEEALVDFSKVALISAKEMSFDVEIAPSQAVQGPSSGEMSEDGPQARSQTALGIASGKENTELGFNKVAVDEDVRVGDIVVSSNLSGKFPRGLLIGEVSRAQKNVAEPFQEGDIKPYFSAYSLDNLFIIINFSR